MTLEMGKRISEARGEVEFSARILAYYAKNAERFLAPVKLHPTVGEAHMESSPIGVIFCVEPWNFPYYQLARVAGPHLMAGNVLMVKHAGIVPQCAIAFEKLWIEAGAPVGLYTNLLISHDQSDRVVDDPRIKGVALTGSVAAGRSIAARAGTEPQAVLDGARRQRRVHRPRRRRSRPYRSSGRSGDGCTTPAKPAARRSGSSSSKNSPTSSWRSSRRRSRPSSRGTRWTRRRHWVRLSTESALLQLLKQVDGAVSHGAKVVMGGKRIDRPGSFMEPTILTDIKPDNPAFRDEFFGPVAMFFRVKDEDEAIALANDSDFGLGGSVFTKDIARGKRVASRVDTGMMFINNIDWSDAELPFGGIKNSGYGRELGDMGIQEFVNKKLVRVASMDAPA